MTFMIGTYVNALTDTHRMEDLGPDAYDAKDANTLIKRAVAFIAGGLTAYGIALPQRRAS